MLVSTSSGMFVCLKIIFCSAYVTVIINLNCTLMLNNYHTIPEKRKSCIVSNCLLYTLLVLSLHDPNLKVKSYH